MPARIHHFGLQRQSFELALPVSLFHDDTDVNFVPRPVDSALGKDKRIEIFGKHIVHAVDVEARKIQLSIFAGIRNERDVIAVARHQRDRGFLADRFFDRSETAMTVCVRFRALDRNAVLAEKIDRHVCERFAFFDRHQKNVVTAVRVFLGQNSDVSDENETRIPDLDQFLLNRVPSLGG